MRKGFRRKDDTHPEKIFTEASSAGPSKGQVVDREAFEKMLDEYYEIAGWDKLIGVPTPRKLAELGIDKLEV